jgi:hypothetical protein
MPRPLVLQPANGVSSRHGDQWQLRGHRLLGDGVSVDGLVVVSIWIACSAWWADRIGTRLEEGLQQQTFQAAGSNGVKSYSLG